MFIIVVFLVFFSSLPTFVLSYSCKSPEGLDVDWFFAYKLPSNGPPTWNKYSGVDYVYADRRTGSWSRPEFGVDSNVSSIGHTVSQVLQAKSNKDFYILYNDEHPDDEASGGGHMKGMVVFDDIAGFWLIHSVPKFPSTKQGKYTYPPTGMKYGQSFLCITFSSASINDISKQLVVGQASVYEKSAPDSYLRLFPMLSVLLFKKRARRIDTISVQKLTSLKGQTFTSFYKSGKFGKDLYEDLVAPNLSSSLYVESWRHGKNIPSECESNYKVYNVLQVKLPPADFNSDNDHAKWAVSSEPKNSWVCIGDINHQVSQEHRGGGTTCLHDPRISALYKSAVEKSEDCPSK